DNVDEISAGVPLHRIWLAAALGVGRAGHDCVSARPRRIPRITPKAPRVMRLLLTKLCRMPSCTRVGRDLHLRDICFTRPGHALNVDAPGFYARTVTWAGDQGLDVQGCHR